MKTSDEGVQDFFTDLQRLALEAYTNTKARAAARVAQQCLQKIENKKETAEFAKHSSTEYL